ncbi:transcription factor E4F1 [Protopterus annectens]|uniref:transcription factor E4F1 n=1 Tax=Protopterus annectens TaxID=7888 RepID=UPI001CFAF684|nr:transcription factor E4F1 [Protopterus annectens]
MNVENNNNTAGEEASIHGSIITVPTAFGEEDEDDVHKCGRCHTEFNSLEAFIQHKIQKFCHRNLNSTSAVSLSLINEETLHTSEDSVTVTQLVVEALPELSNASTADTECTSETAASQEQVLHSPAEHSADETNDDQKSPDSMEEESSKTEAQLKIILNEDGRYVCHLCCKTFKTAHTLRVHMITHSDRKDFACKLCGIAFRTKGSLMRHNRRHTDERPYTCKKCGMSFRESGALTRHLKSLTPCTEKMKFNMNKEIVINKQDCQGKGLDDLHSESITSVPAVSADSSSVISVVTDPKGNVLHVEMQDVPSENIAEITAQQVTSTEELQPDGEINHENLLSQAIRNSGIVIETLTVDDMERSDDSSMTGTEEESSECRTDDSIAAECVGLQESQEVFSAPGTRQLHHKDHKSYRPFNCLLCGKEFITGYLLKKHMSTHFSERRFKCGECGKLYKTVAHVREHMKAHSDERPYPCQKCGKRYKTKNAQQVHFRTHLDDKPFVCQYCSRGFREKGSLIRHVRHHTGEKPFKCHKCGRGFAEHGTLNRHLKAKGGCHASANQAEHVEVTEDCKSSDEVAATILAEDPHTVLVEFSSVVADTQEYILETAGETTDETAQLIEGTQHQVESHIMKVVQQIVNHANSTHQIIVQNVTVDEGTAVATDGMDTITIATPECLTEQVAMTLASAIEEGAVLTTHGGVEAGGEIVTVVSSEDIDMVDHTEEFVVAAHDGEIEVQTVIVD